MSLLLATEPNAYLGDPSWISALGSTLSVDVERYGRVTSLRARLPAVSRLSLALAPADWASRPLIRVPKTGLRVTESA